MGVSCVRSCGVGERRTARGDAVECLPGGENQGANVASDRPGRWPVGTTYISLTSYFLMDASEGRIQERRAPCGRLTAGMDRVVDGVY